MEKITMLYKKGFEGNETCNISSIKKEFFSALKAINLIKK